MENLHALTLSVLYGAVVVGVLLVFLGVTMFVALFTRDDRRANRAHVMFDALLEIFRRRPR